MPKDEKKVGGAAAELLFDMASKAITADLIPNFGAACKLTGFPANKTLEERLSFPAPPAVDGKESARDLYSLCVHATLGAPNVRALCAALLGKGKGMTGNSYKFLKHLVLREAEIGDSGAVAVAEVLRNGSLVELALESVTLMKCGVGIEGALALGSSLMLGACTSLVSLNLDLNHGLGDSGVKALCKGLVSNRTIKRLSLARCSVGTEGCVELGGVLNSPTCIIEYLDISGNDVGLEGLNSLAVSASYSKTLLEFVACNCCLSSSAASSKRTLELAAAQHKSSSSNKDASVLGFGRGGGGEESLTLMVDEPFPPGQAFAALGKALVSTECALGRVNLDGNPLTPEDAEVLLPFLASAPPKVTLFRVPTTLSPAHFTALFKNVIVKGKGKKK